MCKKCIVFSRVSSNRQDFTAQTNTVMRTALEDGYKREEIAVVEAKESAIKLAEEERQTLNEMKRLIEENPSIESVYCFAIDRLARRVSIILSVKDYLLKRNINLVFLNPMKMATLRKDEKTGELVENEMTQLLLMLLSYGAEMEMKIKTERAVNKKTQMKENNQVTGKLIFGYKNVNHQAVIDNKGTAPIVKWVFDSYNYNNMSLRNIFNKGVELGYWDNLVLDASRSNKIRQILINYAYAGIPTKSGFVYPKLIEKEEIDKAIQLMKEAASKAKTQSKLIALAKGKIYDKESGYALQYDGNHLKYFNNNTTKLISGSLNIIDFLTWKEASRVKWNMLANQTNNNKEHLAKEIEQIEDRINNLNNIITNEIAPRFDRLYKAYVNTGRITDEEYNKQSKQIDKEEKKYKQQIESLQQRQTELQSILNDIVRKNDDIPNPHEVMNITDYQHQKEIVDETIDKILVNRTDKGQYIYIYNKLEVEPQIFINNTKTNHKVIHWLLNNEGETIDISDEYRPRYTRKNK